MGGRDQKEGGGPGETGGGGLRLGWGDWGTGWDWKGAGALKMCFCMDLVIIVFHFLSFSCHVSVICLSLFCHFLSLSGRLAFVCHLLVIGWSLSGRLAFCLSVFVIFVLLVLVWEARMLIACCVILLVIVRTFSAKYLYADSLFTGVSARALCVTVLCELFPMLLVETATNETLIELANSLRIFNHFTPRSSLQTFRP